VKGCDFLKERLKELRKTLGMTQAEFSDRIGIKRNTLANYETGRNEPIDGIIFSICREFSVSEEWLRTGKGEMLIFVPSETLDKLAHEYKLSDEAKNFVRSFVELDDVEMGVVLKFMGKMVAGNEEMAAMLEPQDVELHNKAIKNDIDAARAILDAQEALDKEFNQGASGKKEGLLG